MPQRRAAARHGESSTCGSPLNGHSRRLSLLTPHSAFRTPHGRAASFTLIEVLVLVLILGVLLGLLVPALLEAIAAARILQCQDHLRQIGAAYHRYLSDSHGLWPPILSQQPPTALFEQIRAGTGLQMAPPRPAANWGMPGPHWSIVLWPYLGSLEFYTCPADPNAGRRGLDVVGPARAHSVGLLDAPPESYALNVILFRTSDAIRRQAGCTWGTKGDADYNGLDTYTTLGEQRRMFPNLPGLILFFCGASGQTVGSQQNMPFRTTGVAERWAWHPRRASAPFVDGPGHGSNYLHVDGRVEYRDDLPSLVEWGYDLGLPSRPPAP